jgi:N-acetyl-anhydromuramyl-L-alanine amidase AmpD
MELKIIETNIQFRNALSERNTTSRIVLHHSASNASTKYNDIHMWHLNNGWSGIGYHYVIHSDGGVYRGRPEWARGSHAYQDEKHEANSNGVGICLSGNFQLDNPTEAQMQSLTLLIHDIWTRYPGIPVIGHKDVMPTACPGENFPWAELNERLKEVGRVKYKTLHDVPDWGKPVIQKLLAKGSLKGDGDGNINISDDMLRTFIILEREGVFK